MSVSDFDIELLYRKYGPMVLRRCRRLLGSESEAEDAAQDVFVQLLRYRHRIQALFLSSLLYRIATNLCLNRIRRHKRKPEHDSEQQMLYQIASWDEVQAGLILDRLFNRQSESTRVMAVMHYLDGMTLEEVALECRMSVSGVRRRLTKLRHDLHQLEGA